MSDEPIDSEFLIIGAYKDCCVTQMTIIAETMMRISYLKDNENFLRAPKALVMGSIKHLHKSEKNKKVNDEIKALLTD